MKTPFFITLMLLLLLLLLLCSRNNDYKEIPDSKLPFNKRASKTVKDEKEIPYKELGDTGFFRKKLKPSDQETIRLSGLAIPENINREVVTGKPAEAQFFTTYLGEINFKGESIHIFKQFYTVQAAIQKHGHSELILLNNQGATCFEMQSGELPYDLQNGVFHYHREKDTLRRKMESFFELDLVLSCF